MDAELSLSSSSPDKFRRAASLPSTRTAAPEDSAELSPRASVSKSEEFRLFFRLPSDEVLLQDFNCALQENILLQGHIYIFRRHVCFYSNIFGYETKKIIPFEEVTSIRKAKTAAIFPNAIEIVTSEKKHFFGSFLSRDVAYRLITDSLEQNSGARAFTESQDSMVIGVREETAYILVENSIDSKQEDDLSISDRLSEVSMADAVAEIGILREVADAAGSEITEEKTANSSNSCRPLDLSSVQPQDADAPHVPEKYTVLLESKFPVSVDEFFTLFLSDSAYNFLEDFRRKCDDKNLHCTPWRKHEQPGLTREVSFLHPIKLYLGKFGCCKEVQKLYLYRNCHLVIETSQQINDAPFGDHFTVEGVWDIQQDKLEKNMCTLRIYIGLNFLKKNLLKGKIEQSAKDECRDSYSLWTRLAHDFLKQRSVSGPGELRENENHLNAAEVQFEDPPRSETLNNTSRNEHTRNDDTDSVPAPLPGISQENFRHSSPTASNIRESSARVGSRAIATNFLPLLVSLLAILVFLQVCILVILIRSPKVMVITQDASSAALRGYSQESMEFLQARLSSLRGEMAGAMAHLERMHQEQALLQEHLERLNR